MHLRRPPGPALLLPTLIAAGALAGTGCALDDGPALADDSAAALRPATIDVYLSAGEHRVQSAGATKVLASCNQDNQYECGLWKVPLQLDLATGRYQVQGSAARLPMSDPADDRVELYPQLNPAGRVIAYESRDRVNSTTAPYSTVWSSRHFRVQDLSAPATAFATVVSPSTGTARYGSWHGDRELLFSDEIVPDPTVDHWEVSHTATLSPTLAVTSRTQLLGLGAADPCRSAGQPRANPVDQRLISTHGRRVDEVGSSCDWATAALTDGYGLPEVLKLSSAPAGPLVKIPVDAHVAGAGALGGCAHTHWRPDGKALLCTSQKTSIVPFAGGWSYDLPFEFEATGSLGSAGAAYVTTDRAVSAGYDFGSMFEPRPLTATSGHDLTQLHLDPECDKIAYKFVEYCGSADLLVATLQCTNSTKTIDVFGYALAPGSVAASRVVLLDIRDPHDVRYVDLTSQVAHTLTIDPAHTAGLFATCAVPAS